MNSKTFIATVAAVAGLVITAAAVFGPSNLTKPVTSAHAQGVAVTDKAAIEKIVREYLLENPELFIEIQSALEAKMEKQQSEKFKAALSENAKDLYRRPEAPVAGNKDGDITVTEFFDYNCGYCKKSFVDVQALIKSDNRVRVVLKELPILSADSVDAAKIALGAKLQGKYWEVHSGLLESKARATGASALAIAAKLGLDMAKLKADAEGPVVKAELDAVRQLASKMGVNGTPHFMVGDRSISGAPADLQPCWPMVSRTCAKAAVNSAETARATGRSCCFENQSRRWGQRLAFLCPWWSRQALRLDVRFFA
ncbi:MAG: DsbA family protein [Verrucomicrobiae bacterium]|nr:DsbA family protein [Verrucomicrobiae bacterium]